MQYSAVTDDSLRYDRFDLDKLVEEQEIAVHNGTAARSSGLKRQFAAPVPSSYQRWHVAFPSRLAVVTMVMIFIYEVLVGVSMGVRVLRYVMYQWLGWVLLSFDIFLLIVLGLVVAFHRFDIKHALFGKVKDTAIIRGVTDDNKHEYTGQDE
jgi:hypothetical protein